MDKIRIGENEYVFPIEVICADCLYDRDSGDWEDGRECKCDDAEMYYTIDAAGNHITPHEEMGIIAALRQERDALKARVEEFGAVFDTWWEHYSTQSSDKKQDGWGWIDEAWSNLKQRNTTPGGDE